MADTKISALTAVGSVVATHEFAVNEAGTSKKANAAQLMTFTNTSPIFTAGSATAGSWPKFAAGSTLLTTPEVGAIELDANCLYATTDAGNRGIIPVRHIIRANATRTFTSNTLAQTIFTSPTNGRITLEAGLYRVGGLLNFTGMSATSGNLLLNLLGAGTATIGSWLWHAWGVDAAAATAAAEGGEANVTSSSPASVVVAGTGVVLTVSIDGTFAITVAGTMIPSITMVTASASVLSVGSFLTFERIGSTGMVSVGQWD